MAVDETVIEIFPQILLGLKLFFQQKTIFNITYKKKIIIIYKNKKKNLNLKANHNIQIYMKK